jgi:hypothetical protein
MSTNKIPYPNLGPNTFCLQPHDGFHMISRNQMLAPHIGHRPDSNRAVHLVITAGAAHFIPRALVLSHPGRIKRRAGLVLFPSLLPTVHPLTAVPHMLLSLLVATRGRRGATARLCSSAPPCLPWPQ